MSMTKWVFHVLFACVLAGCGATNQQVTNVSNSAPKATSPAVTLNPTARAMISPKLRHYPITVLNDWVYRGKNLRKSSPSTLTNSRNNERWIAPKLVHPITTLVARDIGHERSNIKLALGIALAIVSFLVKFIAEIVAKCFATLKSFVTFISKIVTAIVCLFARRSTFKSPKYLWRIYWCASGVTATMYVLIFVKYTFH